MSGRRSTAQMINAERGAVLLQILREDREKNAFICRIVEKVLRSCGVSDKKIDPAVQSRIYTHVWNASYIPEQDKPFVVAKISYGSRL